MGFDSFRLYMLVWSRTHCLLYNQSQLKQRILSIELKVFLKSSSIGICHLPVTETIKLLAKQEWLFYVDFFKKSISMSYFWSCYIQAEVIFMLQVGGLI